MFIKTTLIKDNEKYDGNQMIVKTDTSKTQDDDETQFVLVVMEKRNAQMKVIEKRVIRGRENAIAKHNLAVKTLIDTVMS